MTAPSRSLPDRRVGGFWIAGFSTAWLGVWMAQLVPMQLLLPEQVDRLVATDSWSDSVLAFGAVSGLSAVCAVVAYPLTGALSDRTVSRFGRRRPWIGAGAALFAVCLVLLGVQHTVWGVSLLWAGAIVGFCAVSAALTAMIADQVPTGQRGLVSGFVSAPQGVGLILGLLLVTELLTGAVWGYLGLGIALAALVIPALFLPDAPLAPGDRAPWGLRRVRWPVPRLAP